MHSCQISQLPFVTLGASIRWVESLTSLGAIPESPISASDFQTNTWNNGGRKVAEVSISRITPCSPTITRKGAGNSDQCQAHAKAQLEECRLTWTRSTKNSGRKSLGLRWIGRNIKSCMGTAKNLA